MKVFISWSGDRSRYVAEALKNWMPNVLQVVNPWMSEEDISTGTRWNNHIANELEQAQVGICCITVENQHRPWVMFEAGALSKMIASSYVIPYLIDMSVKQLSGPMEQFQSAIADREGTSRVMHTLNKAAGDILAPARLDTIFGVWWPELEQKLTSLPEKPNEDIVQRSTEEILEEVVRNTREQLRREDIRLNYIQVRDEKAERLISSLENMMTTLVTSFGQKTNIMEILEMVSKDLPSNKLKIHTKQLQERLHLMEEMEKEFPNILQVAKEMHESDKKETKILIAGDIRQSIEMASTE